MRNSERLKTILKNPESQKIFDDIYIEDFMIAPVPNNHINLFIIYKGIHYSLSKFHFVINSDLKEVDNWFLEESRANHAVDHPDAMSGVVCECGKEVNKKHQVTVLDFCQSLSQMDFKLLLLSKFVSNELLMRKINKKMGFQKRLTFVSCYHRLDELDLPQLHQATTAFSSIITTRTIEKTGDHSFTVYFDVPDLDISYAMKKAEKHEMEDGYTFINYTNSEVYHNSEHKMGFCPICVGNEKDTNGNYTICSPLMTKQHLSTLAQVIEKSDKEQRVKTLLKTKSVGDQMSFVHNGQNLRIIPPMNVKSVEDLEEVTSFIQQLEKNVGRNEPCSCGSGKKYKKCCINK